MIKAVIFDMGGVLYDWKKGWREVSDKLGWDYEKFMKIVLGLVPSAEIGEMSLEDFFKRIGKKAGLDSRWVEMDNNIPFNFPKIKETFQLLSELRGKYKLAVLTNNPPEIMDRWEKVGNYKRYFDLIIDSSEVGLRKPNKEIFELICQKLKLEPEECLFVEDSLEHIEAARRLGFKIVYFTEPKKGVEKVREILKIT